MELFVHEKTFDVRYRDVDFKDELKPSSAFSYFEEVASLSADKIGLGMDFLKPKGYAFVLSNVVCEFLRPIKHGESIVARTWPLPPSFATFGREYLLLSDGETVAKASSRWCLLDFASGKLLTAKAVDNQDYSRYKTEKVFESVCWKIPAFPLEEGLLSFATTVANSEYDHNFHVNNTRYIDYFFNCFSVAELAERTPKNVSVSYVKQCREGDCLSFYRKKTDKNTFLLLGVNQNGETVATGVVEFAEKNF